MSTEDLASGFAADIEAYIDREVERRVQETLTKIMDKMTLPNQPRKEASPPPLRNRSGELGWDLPSSPAEANARYVSFEPCTDADLRSREMTERIYLFLYHEDPRTCMPAAVIVKEVRNKWRSIGLDKSKFSAAVHNALARLCQCDVVYKRKFPNPTTGHKKFHYTLTKAVLEDPSRLTDFDGTGRAVCSR